MILDLHHTSLIGVNDDWAFNIISPINYTYATPWARFKYYPTTCQLVNQAVCILLFDNCILKSCFNKIIIIIIIIITSCRPHRNLILSSGPPVRIITSFHEKIDWSYHRLLYLMNWALAVSLKLSTSQRTPNTVLKVNNCKFIDLVTKIRLTPAILMPLLWNFLRNSTTHFCMFFYFATWFLTVTVSLLCRS